jgi:large repetitive protein
MVTAAVVALAVTASAAGGFSDARSNPGNSFQAAASFCVDAGEEVLAASRDSYVDSLLTGSNFGTQTQLSVGPAYLSLLSEQQALVGFDLPAIPSRCTLTAATLRLYATTPASGRTIEVFRASAAWTETGVTWTNRPATTGSAASSASLSSPGFQSWNVLSQVSAIYTGTNNGFVVRDPGGGVLPPRQVYQSREGTPTAQDPELRLTFG